MIGAPYLIFDVEMEMLQVCGPLLMEVILQFALYLHELQRIMISVDDNLLLENVMLPLVAKLYNVLHLLIVCGVLEDGI